MKQSWRHTLVLPAIAGFVVVVDQLSKHLVMTWLEVGQSQEVAPWLNPIFRLTYVTNTGVAFGLFPGVGYLFMFLSDAIAVVILIYGYQLPPDQWLLRLVLAFPLGGAIGNLVDRVRQGFVVDFIDLTYWPMRDWPIFNLADSATIAGVVLMSVLMLWDYQCEQESLRAIEDG